MSTQRREAFLNQQVLRLFVEALPRPSYGTDERGRVVLRAEPPPVIDGSAPRKKRFLQSKNEVALNRTDRMVELVTENELKCHAVICALANDRLARTLFRCSQCQQFFLAKAAHRRAHNFCRPDHRRAYDLAHRDSKAMALYMRNYRKNRMVRRRRERSRSSSAH